MGSVCNLVSTSCFPFTSQASLAPSKAGRLYIWALHSSSVSGVALPSARIPLRSQSFLCLRSAQTSASLADAEACTCIYACAQPFWEASG